MKGLIRCWRKRAVLAGSRFPDRTERSVQTLAGRRAEILAGNGVLTRCGHDERTRSGSDALARTGSLVRAIAGRLARGLPLLAALTLPPAVAGETWVLASGYGEAMFQTRNLVRFAADVRAATGGRLTIEVRPGGKHLPLAKIRPAVERGEVALGEFNLSAEAEVDPLLGLDALPFVTQSYADAELLWKLSRPAVEQVLRRRGLEVLYAVPWPPQGLYSRRPLGRVEDLARSRLRSYNPATRQLARLLGAEPQDVPLVELRDTLARGGLDVLLTSATSGVDVRAWDYMPHYYDVRSWFPKNIVTVNAAALATLAPAERRALFAAAQAAEQRGWQDSRDQDAADRAQLAARGMRIESASPELAAGLQRAGEKLVRDYLRNAGSDALSVLLAFNLQRAPAR